MRPPHPFISCGNISKEEKASPLYKHIERLVLPVFEEALQETNKNHMVVGSVGSNNIKSVYVQPHNYRSYFKYSRDTALIDTLKNPSGLYKTEGRLTEGGVGSVYYKKINHDKELSFPEFCGCRVVIKKHSIEVVNKINHKDWFPVRMIPDIIEAQITDIVRQKDEQSIEVLKKFISIFGGVTDYKILNAISEVKVAGEDKINTFPDKMRFHNEVSKKVYGNPNVEFKSAALASKYIENRSKEDFLEDKFEELRIEIMSSKPLLGPLQDVQLDIKEFPVDVLKSREPIMKLSEEDRALLSFWFFEEFGVKV